ncbi:hypothetical protein LCGC14_0782050 [marine sediment metagenome]|uniref:Uncharacterized protein n=1 Tax=marine sediment metagenome TaxID=412755 RepID=A0A0F9PVE9_9ZZZZ
MFILDQKPQFTVVQPPRQLQEGYLVRFSEKWPSTFSQIRGKTFRIQKTSQIPYDLSYIIPVDDYRDIDLSNGTGSFMENLYPTNDTTLYEVSLGLKLGNYVVHFYLPATQNISGLEQASMINPDVTDAKEKFLGARQPKDSPYDNPQMKFYLVKDLSPLIVRPVILSNVDYELVVLGFVVNKCKIELIPSPTKDELQKAKEIKYYEEITRNW